MAILRNAAVFDPALSIRALARLLKRRADEWAKACGCTIHRQLAPTGARGCNAGHDNFAGSASTLAAGVRSVHAIGVLASAVGPNAQPPVLDALAIISPPVVRPA